MVLQMIFFRTLGFWLWRAHVNCSDKRRLKQSFSEFNAFCKWRAKFCEHISTNQTTASRQLYKLIFVYFISQSICCSEINDKCIKMQFFTFTVSVHF